MEFINRNIDFEKIKHIVNNNSEQTNQVIIIHADKGVGKSNFLKEVLKNSPNGIIPIKIEHSSGNINVSEHYLIQKLDIQIEQICEKYNLDDKKRVFNSKKRTSEYCHFLSKIISFYSNCLTLLIDLINSYKNKQDKELYTTDFHYLTSTESYILKMLKKRRFWINIEDVHLLSQSSIDFLTKMIKEPSSNMFFLELTCKKFDTKLADWENIVQKCGIDPAIIELSEFTIDDLLKVAKSVNESCDSEKIKLKYANYNGNLKLVRLDARNGDISLERNAAKAALEKLSNKHIALLSLVANYTLPITKSKVQELISLYSNKSNLFPSEFEISTIENDICNEILKVNCNTISINHNTISDILLNDSEYVAVNLISYKILEQHYRSELRRFETGSSDFNRGLEHLLLLYGKFDVKCLLGEIDNIKLMSLAQVSNSSSTRFLNQIKDYVKSHDKIDVFREVLIDAYYTTSNFTEAFNLLQNKSSKPYYILMKGFLYYRQGEHSEAKKIIDAHIYTFPESSKNRLIASIIKLILLIVTNKHTEKERFFNEILKNVDFRKMIEFGYVLRLAEEMDRDDSEKLVEDSINHFNAHSDKYEVARSKITLSIIKSLKGDFKAGRVLLYEAKKTMNYRRIETYNILNNLSVIEMLTGNFDNSIINNLQLAESYANSAYDLYLIRNNILAYAINVNDLELAKKYYKILIEYLAEFSKDSLKCDIYYNIAKYNEKIANQQSTIKFIDKIKALQNNLDTFRQKYWEHRLTESKVDFGIYSGLMKNDCHLSFSSNWWFSISYD